MPCCVCRRRRLNQEVMTWLCTGTVGGVDMTCLPRTQSDGLDAVFGSGGMVLVLCLGILFPGRLPHGGTTGGEVGGQPSKHMHGIVAYAQQAPLVYLRGVAREQTMQPEAARELRFESSKSGLLILNYY
ncbi:hypothetical protein BC832DRAFT_563826 [Gaertneriomyces semiglobifer]|nr:hypothetical protein BC832DRAFT_563826 [Gaertneriomyces semiglobifer]